MRTNRILATALAILAIAGLLRTPASGEVAPGIASLSKPSGGSMQMLFHGGTGPFQIQKRNSGDPASPWIDIPEAKITEINTGVYMAVFPMGNEDVALYRVLSMGETIAELKGWSVKMAVSAPANGTHFVAGEAPVVTVTLLDNYLQGVSKADFSSLNLYMYGPQDPTKMITAVKLLNATTNRAARPHHYIDLKSNTNVANYNNVFSYQLQPVTDEKPGTYRLSLWASRASDGIQQVMRFADVQIGTDAVEPKAVFANTQCAACHKGAASGKMYLHHIDPGFSPTGNWSLDYDTENSCYACHNNDGYAAYSTPSGPVSDTLARRVHGVHMGEELGNPANTDPATGSFRNYTHTVFPPDVRNCTKCHVDDRWKTVPTRMACGSCHDTCWFGPESSTPPGMVAHEGGPKVNDNTCNLCHDADAVASYHEIPPQVVGQIQISMSTPLNGSNYVAGESPMVSVVIVDSTGAPIDHTKVTDGNFSTASMMVYGPRAHAVPVLTSAAKNGASKLRASVSNNKDGPWDINGKTLKLAVNGNAPVEVTFTGATNLVTAAEVVAQLNAAITNFGAKATVSGARVNIRTTIQGPSARFEIYNGDVTTAMVWKRPPNTTTEPDVTVASTTTSGNDLRQLSDPLDYVDPMVTRSAANVSYQLDDVAGLAPGTYGVYVYDVPKAGKIPGITNGMAFITFQVGTATPEKKVATNCKDCHGELLFHLTGNFHPGPFDVDSCNACHDYGHYGTGDMFKNQGGTSLAGWSGYGAMPIVRRVHGIHVGAYLEHPEEIYANATVDTFGHMIFPQDARNCTKCHAETDSWKKNPSRVACLACHDTDAAKAHGLLNTYMPDPADPYGPKAVESCDVCHGDGAEFSADKVHNISKPYVPPYPREKE